ncbi:hypothetical protein D3C81_1253690 [compost metagenome]
MPEMMPSNDMSALLALKLVPKLLPPDTTMLPVSVNVPVPMLRKVSGATVPAALSCQLRLELLPAPK